VRPCLLALAAILSLFGPACSDDGSGAGGTSSGGGGGSAGDGNGNGGSGDGASIGDGAGGTGGGGGSEPTSSLEGYWVWTKQIENGQVTLEVTDADMEPKVGPSGWPGCPDGILCTRYGIHKVAFGEAGRLHQQHNVTTSSDFQTLGTWADGGAGVATFERQEQFSCAHPDQVNADVAPGGFRHEMVDGELRISVSGFGGFPFVDPGAAPTTWLSYKPVTREDYYGKYMIRFCQPFAEFMCHAACFDDSLVDEP